MKIHEAAQVEEGTTNIYELIKGLSVRSFSETNIDEIFKEINIERHDVMNPLLRKDKPIYRPKPKAKTNAMAPNSAYAALKDKLDAGNPDSDLEFQRMEYVNRIPLSFQELICSKRVSFCLANPAIRTYSGIKKERQAEIDKYSFAMERILRDNKIPTHDREAARNIFTYTEVAEYWYTIQYADDKRSNKYGFDSNQQLKVILYSREDGYKFFPMKDGLNNLICFSMQYQSRENGKLVTFFRTFTDEESALYKRTGAYQWEQVGKIVKLDLGKIPIVFGWQRHPEYRNASHAIKRLEKLLSNHGEVNDYHAAPKLFLSEADKITGVGSKNESGIVLQGTGKADARYITWDNATDSVKLEIENLLMLIYTLTQTPNINFDNIKGLGAVSGVSIKLLFMDSHLAVKDKEGILKDYYQRRHSIIGAYLALMEPSLEKTADEIEVNTELVPFMIADDKERAEIIQIQNGMLPVKSQETSIIESGGDREEIDRIAAETEKRELTSISEPTF